MGPDGTVTGAAANGDPEERARRILLWVLAVAVGVSIVGSLLFLQDKFAHFPFAWF